MHLIRQILDANFFFNGLSGAGLGLILATILPDFLITGIILLVTGLLVADVSDRLISGI